MSELKKCPFCGGEAELIEFYITGSANTKHFFVRCKKCRARRGVNSFSHPQIARNEWNTRADGWISVKDELPEKNEQVMIYVKTYFGHEIDIARLEGKKKDIFRTLDVSYELEEVTHWQPLPEPPKGD